MRDAMPMTVIGKDGLTGVLLDPLPQRPGPRDTVRIRLADGRVFPVPADIVVAGSDGTYLIPAGLDDLDTPAAPPASSTEESVIPVLVEELVVGKKAVPTGGVRVNRRVLEHDETVEVPLLREHVDVRRVLIDREVDGPLPIRREGETTIIPVVEEILVVEKRYRLKEEIHVSRTVSEEIHREQVTVRHQQADVEQLDEHGRGRVVQPVEATRAPEPRRPRKSILGDS
jgi:uncharacterized protein (TIGR02271 family)